MACSPTLWKKPQNASLRSELTAEYTYYRYMCYCWVSTVIMSTAQVYTCMYVFMYDVYLLVCSWRRSLKNCMWSMYIFNIHVHHIQVLIHVHMLNVWSCDRSARFAHIACYMFHLHVHVHVICPMYYQALQGSVILSWYYVQCVCMCHYHIKFCCVSLPCLYIWGSIAYPPPPMVTTSLKYHTTK